MSSAIAHPVINIPTEQIKMIGNMMASLEIQLEPALKIARQQALAQQRFIEKTVKPAIESINSARIIAQPQIDSLQKTGKMLSKLGKSVSSSYPQVRRIPQQESVNIFPAKPRQEPSRLTTDDAIIIRTIIREELAQQPQTPQLQPSQSIFCWDRYGLEIEDQFIALTETEKIICSYVFRNPDKKCFELYTVEETVYGLANLNSNRFKQAIKRINGKVKRCGFDPIFSYGQGFLNVEI